MHRNENHRAAAGVGEKLAKNDFRRAGWNQSRKRVGSWYRQIR